MITAVENVLRKGNHEHAHEQSYVGPDQQCLVPLAGLPSALSLAYAPFFIAVPSFLSWLWCG